MKFHRTFAVEKAPDDVFAFLCDAESVTACIKGAAITGNKGDGSYDVAMGIAVGPVSAQLSGDVELRSRAGDRTGTLTGTALDPRTRAGAQATVEFGVVSDSGDGSVVSIEAEFDFSGSLAPFARTEFMRMFVERMFADFVSSLSSALLGTHGRTSDGASAGAASDVAQPIAPKPFGRLAIRALRCIRKWISRAGSNSAIKET